MLKNRDGLAGKFSDNPELIRGHARFTGRSGSTFALTVGERALTADQVVLDTGTRSQIPKIEGLDKIDYLKAENWLDHTELPDHLAMIGGGYVGLEMGQFYRRMGSRVTVWHHGPRIAPREDGDVSAAMQKFLEREGIEFRLNVEVKSVKQLGASHVFIGTGRHPNTDDLGLETAGVARDAHGYITVDDQLRTSVPGIWALGDCNGRGGFTHTSYNDYEIAAANILDNQPRRVSDRITAYNLYIDPPLGRAGMTEAEVRKSGRRALVATRPMTRVGRAVEKGETRGFMKILVDADSREILGASILGTGGDEVIHCILDVMYARAPYTVLQRAMHIHPTVSELVPTLLGDLKPLTPAP